MAKSKKNNNLMSESQQMKALKYAYGASLDWVDITLPLTHNQVLSYFGPQCQLPTR